MVVDNLKVSRESMPIWAEAVDDDNPIHTNVETAKALKFEGKAIFEDTPVHATRIAAYVEQAVLDELNDDSLELDKLVYAGQTLKFLLPFYPDRKATLISVHKEVEGIEGLDLNISLMSKEEELASGVANLRLTRSKIESEILDSFLDPENKSIVKRRNTKIDINKLQDFYECLGRGLNGRIAMMYIATGIPAALLTLLPREKGTPKGTYHKMELQFYNQPVFDDFQTIIRMPSPPREGKNGYLYSLEALCLQRDIPILSGKVICSSEEKIKIN